AARISSSRCWGKRASMRAPPSAWAPCRWGYLSRSKRSWRLFLPEKTSRTKEETERLDRHYGLAVELQLLDRLVDVGERLVLALLHLHHLLRPSRLPPPHQLLQGRAVEVGVVEERLQLRQPAREEPPVLADRVAAHG